MPPGLTAKDEHEAFAKLVETLEPYLDRIVFVGGWVQQFYARDHRGVDVDFEPIHTADVDVAAPIEIKKRGTDIATLLKEAGFEEHLHGDFRPPVSHYRLGVASNSFEVEFIAPLTGSGRKRSGEPDATVDVAGVIAQKLRYVDLLLMDPWQYQLEPGLDFPVTRSHCIQVANPACYLAQKILVLPVRKRDRKDAKDLLYVHDTVVRFADHLDELHDIWKTVAAGLSPKVTGRVRSELEELRSKSALASQAVQIARETDRPSCPTAENLLMTILDGLEEIFLRES